MALVVTFRIPSAAAVCLVSNYGTPAADSQAIKADVKKALCFAIENNFEITGKTPISGLTERINLSLPASLESRIDHLAALHGMEESEVCRELVIAVAQRNSQVADVVPDGCGLLESIWAASPGRDKRIAQAEVFLNIKAAMDQRKIALTEAGTGTGKTLAMIAAAEETIRENDGERCAIAVPTIALMRQFAMTHQSIVDAGIDIHPIRCIIGRREFVSLSELKSISDQAKYVEHRAAIEHWIASDGAPLDNSPIKQKWLVHTLKEIAPGFPAEACAMEDVPDEIEPGYLAYRQQFDVELFPLSEIILCSHAMLAVSTKLRMLSAHRNADYAAMKRAEFSMIEAIREEASAEEKLAMVMQLNMAKDVRNQFGAEITEQSGILPGFSFLMIDEAHLFENAMASANASYVSVQSFVRLAKKVYDQGGGLSKEKLARLERCCNEIQSLSEKDDILLTGMESCALRAKSLLKQILEASEISQSKKKKKTAAALRLDAERCVIKTAIESQYLRALMRYSPVKAFPQILVGKTNVDPLMAFLWSSVDAAACVSATLYLRNDAGYSSFYQRMLLNIKEARLLQQKPVTPPWMYSAVQGVWLPPETPVQINDRTWLRPPTRRDKLSDAEHKIAEDLWLDDVAQAILSIHQTAAGGLLVLMTSYATIHALAAKLPVEVARVLITARQDENVTEQAKGFLRLREAGEKAIWLATGAAWTGVDVGGHDPWKALFGTELPAEEDNVITDLVIPKVPYGMNKSLTHDYRMRTKSNIQWDEMEAMFRLRQGIGRPVRREGLPKNRRFFLLDGRLSDKRGASTRSSVLRIIRPYGELLADTLRPLLVSE